MYVYMYVKSRFTEMSCKAPEQHMQSIVITIVRIHMLNTSKIKWCTYVYITGFEKNGFLLTTINI